MKDLRYPIGPFRPQSLTHTLVTECIAAIDALPRRLRDAITDLGDAQLDTPYRQGGWTVRQVVHHLADSHVNAWCRMRLTLTEDNPLIRAYDEKAWAELVDARTAPVDVSLRILDGLHARWGRLLDGVELTAWDRPLRHPEAGDQTLGWLLQLYAWHGRHHTAHITTLRERQRW